MRRHGAILEGLKRVNEMKVFDVKGLAKFAGNLLSNKYGAKDVEVTMAQREENDFYIEIKFMTEKELKPVIMDKLADELMNNYEIPTSSTGGGFAVNISDMQPLDKGFLVTIEIYN